MTGVWKKLRSNRMNSEESGYILIMSLFVLIILFLIGTTLAVLGIQEFTLSSRTKLMDQAYAIADAGVNRTAVALQMDSNLAKTTTPGPYPTAQSGPFTENFGGGSFTWTLYQSDTMPTNSNYKVIQSRGTISKSGRTAERTIETRIIVGAGGQEYDASFDYLFYNGNKDNPNNPPVWPDTGMGFVSGNYNWDGASSYNGHTPKGAVYVKGSINLPVVAIGGLCITGNVVATDNITLQNSWNASWTTPGLSIGRRTQDNSWNPPLIVQPGKLIAGLDGVGSNGIGGTTTIKAAVTAAVACSTDIYGQAIAYDDVNVTATTNVNFFNSALKIERIKAGRDVTFSGTVNLSDTITLGTIIAGRKVTINSNWANGVSAADIYAGQDTGDWKGVILNTSSVSSIHTGNITSRGKVSASSSLSTISVGIITAGNDQAVDTGGTGVDWSSSILSGATSQGITSAGNVIFTESAGSNYTCNGNICSGGYVNLNARELWLANDAITTGNISAKGYVNVRSGDNVTVGNITSEGWVGVRSADDIRTGQILSNSTGGGVSGYAIFVDSTDFIGGLGNQAYTNGTVQARGPVFWESSARIAEPNSQITGGVWGTYVHINRNDFFDVSDTELYIGQIPGTGDSVRCGNNNGFYCHGAGDIFDNDISSSQESVGRFRHRQVSHHVIES